MSRPRLLAAVRDRMRTQAAARTAEEARAAPAPPQRRPPAAARDIELEQLEAEARYHHDRHALYQARVMSAGGATSATRLRDLRRTATAAAERLAHARRVRRRDSR